MHGVHVAKISVHGQARGPVPGQPMLGLVCMMLENYYIIKHNKGSDHAYLMQMSRYLLLCPSNPEAITKIIL